MIELSKIKTVVNGCEADHLIIKLNYHKPQSVGTPPDLEAGARKHRS